MSLLFKHVTRCATPAGQVHAERVRWLVGYCLKSRQWQTAQGQTGGVGQQSRMDGVRVGVWQGSCQGEGGGDVVMKDAAGPRAAQGE